LEAATGPKPTAETIKALNTLIKDPWFNEKYAGAAGWLPAAQSRAIEERED
jgi:hypothetical protein